MLTARELDDARADVLETLVSTCVIQRPGAGTAGTAWGFPSQDWSAVGTVVCRVDPVTRNDMLRGVLAERESLKTFYIGSFKWDADLQAGDRVVFESNTMELLNLWDDHSARILRRATLAQVEGD